jgi:lipopolysaccharide export system protein LptA
MIAAVFTVIRSPSTVHAAEIALSEVESIDPITIAADNAQHWTQGVYEVWVLEGNCYLNQGQTYARSQGAVLWIEQGGVHGDPPHKVIAYLEGKVSIDFAQSFDTANQATTKPKARITDRQWLGRFFSRAAPNLRVKNTTGEPPIKPPLFQRALDIRNGEKPPQASQNTVRGPQLLGTGQTIRRTQFTTPAPGGVVTSPRDPFARPGEEVPLGAPTANAGAEQVPVGARRVRVYPRSDVRVQAQWFPSPNVPNEWIAIISSGVNLIVDGLDNFGSIDVATDRLVIWTQGQEQPDLTGQSLQSQDTPFEIYMEGNIVFRQGDRVVFADRMYYDARREQGTVLNAEVLTPIPSFQGLARLRAEVLQQVNRDQFIAKGASITTSRLGIPSYDFRAGELIFQDIQQPAIDPVTRQPIVDPETQEPVVNHQRRLTSRNNVLAVEQVPLLYWPTFTTDLEEPTFYIERMLFKQDSIFGTQIYTDLNMYQVLGLENPPEGTKFTGSVDYLSMRGPAGGLTFLYDRPDFLTLQGPTYGLIDAWGIHDDGNDNLGRERRDIDPFQKFRGRVFGRHRQYFEDGYQLTAEVGYISDYNFLEQYYENEWDEFKDESTGIEFKRYLDNMSYSLSVDARLNPFFTQTEQLPRFDHYWLGQSLFGDRITWYEHTSVEYAKLQTAGVPPDPKQAAFFAPMVWEVPSEGERFATRHEFDLPFALGPVKIVPYALGEYAHWGQVIDGDSLDRLYGQFGVRGSVPFSSVNPEVEDELLNLHGLAHKLVFDVDAGFTTSNQNYDQFPLYDPVDDDDIEAYRRFYPFFDFGGAPIPLQFDERTYAIRTGLAGNVASPSTEIANDLMAVRLGLRQRWQTKRGPEQNQHILDWITFDTEAVIFPDAERDNFGESIGLVNYNFTWHVGDRLTLLSDGMFDFFPNAPKYVSVGGYLNRPPRGNLYLGFLSFEGPITSNVVATAYSYRMSPKWASTFGSTFNIGNGGNIGQSLTLTRIGEAFLISMGVNVDVSKGNVGANFAIEPRILSRLGRTSTGMQIPPAGAFGLE